MMSEQRLMSEVFFQKLEKMSETADFQFDGTIAE
jgi:hypothetical protein